jgi:hypothetical protein
MNIYNYKIDDAVQTLEFSPTRERDEATHYISVYDGSTALIVGVGRAVNGNFEPARNVSVSLTRNNEAINDNDRNATFLNGSLVSYIAENPIRGEWVLKVAHESPEPFIVSAAVFRRPLNFLLSFASQYQCKACKVSLRAIIFALLAKLTAGGIAAIHAGNMAEMLRNLPEAILQLASHAIGVPLGWLRRLLENLGEIFGWETPWGWLARRICEELGLCRAGAKDD